MFSIVKRHNHYVQVSEWMTVSYPKEIRSIRSCKGEANTMVKIPISIRNKMYGYWI